VLLLFLTLFACHQRSAALALSFSTLAKDTVKGSGSGCAVMELVRRPVRAEIGGGRNKAVHVLPCRPATRRTSCTRLLNLRRT
jgi:hypothetical protein